MNIFIYDNTFEGLLSAVFYAYDTKIFPDKIVRNSSVQDDFFAEKYTIYTNRAYAKRVWEGIINQSSEKIAQKVYRVYLSELNDVEMLIFRYVQLLFKSQENIDTNYGNPIVLNLNKLYTKVTREAHRAVMFIRFQKTGDGIYYAPFEAKYNVLPLVVKHFKDRLPDQQWVIYDTKRNYGFYYDLTDVREIQITESQVNQITGKVNKELLADNEMDFQELWHDYYQSTTIRERTNLKVHKQFLPKRFWKFLPEKNYSFYANLSGD